MALERIESSGSAQSAIEADIARLAAEVKEKSAGEKSREVLRQAVRPVIYGTQAQPGMQSPAGGDGVNPSSYLPDYVNRAPEEVRLAVETLLETAFKNGVEEAAKKAKLAGPFVLDAFHDALVDKLYAEMKERKLI
ncbi:MAG: hypothetical protein M1153_00370 [Patescibacteria group bacterium]|nr:hypothetical protein [Patescibacteria group bacterium]